MIFQIDNPHTSDVSPHVRLHSSSTVHTAHRPKPVLVAFVWVCTSRRACAFVRVCVCARARVCVCVCVCVRVSVSLSLSSISRAERITREHTRTHTRTHTHARARPLPLRVSLFFADAFRSARVAVRVFCEADLMSGGVVLFRFSCFCMFCCAQCRVSSFPVVRYIPSIPTLLSCRAQFVSLRCC